MNDTSVGTIALAIMTFIAGGGGVFILNWFRQKREQLRADRKQDSDIKVSETEKAFNIYKEIFTSLKKEMEAVSQGHQELEKQYLECREARAILQGKYELLAATLDNIQKDKENLLKELAELRKNGVDKNANSV